MNKRELEQLEKRSIYSLEISNDLKESVVQSEILELNRVIKKEVRRGKLFVVVTRID